MRKKEKERKEGEKEEEEEEEDVPEVFGSQREVNRGKELAIRGILKNKLLSPTAHIFLNDYAKCISKPRNECFQFYRENPHVAGQQEIKKPVIIVGMNRSGTTLLHNLLHCDPSTRSPLFYEMYGHRYSRFPLITSRKGGLEDPRVAMIDEIIELGRKICPETTDMQWKCHKVSGTSVEEDYVICTHQSLWIVHCCLMEDDGEYERFVMEENKDFAFEYLKLYLKMLQTGYAPSSHWTLKSPTHLLYLPSLFSSFPDASLLICHRHPLETIPSFCYLVESIFRVYFHNMTWDRRRLGPFVTRLYKRMADRMMKFRKEHPELKEKFMDIKFKEFVSDPLAMSDKIYEWMGKEKTQETSDAMKTYLISNPKHKYGKPDATLEKYGLNRDEICELFSQYIEEYCS
eukprot:CAMPEP_0201509158 /NCGR_PEP_ID=MMETSP0161_2-20130828/2291_1 /ASSEMBLY_ACC=CAM_ASM_000251 /TAXON_ID=180227 /ORGANISM="Neoparamoeba aestuarina, Strain SoJaBio B1-5/56/2" /LENGTH=401 /DNA_ID=CAMNT_0047904023 /DNA_START=203 /DNA_END=1408 /DNA_ORIENTATION=+